MATPVDIEIYTTDFCPYCVQAKALLDKLGLAYKEISVDGDPAGRAKMTARANGRTSVPQIFFGNTHIGGCDDLHDLYYAGKLDRILADLAQ